MNGHFIMDYSMFDVKRMQEMCDSVMPMILMLWEKTKTKLYNNLFLKEINCSLESSDNSAKAKAFTKMPKEIISVRKIFKIKF